MGYPPCFSAGSGPTSVALGDLDDNGTLDVVVNDPALDAVLVLLGDGLGGFGPASSFSTGSGPGAVMVAELNGDCYADVASADEEGDSVSVPARRRRRHSGNCELVLSGRRTVSAGRQ